MESKRSGRDLPKRFSYNASMNPTPMRRFEKRIPVKRCDKFTIKAQKTGLFPGSHRLG